MPPARALLFVTTAVALALVVKGAFLAPLPLWVVLVALGAYVTVVMLGVFPFLYGVRAIQAKEPLAPLSMLAAVGTVVLGFTAFVR